jgi:hypothetical protein
MYPFLVTATSLSMQAAQMQCAKVHCVVQGVLLLVCYCNARAAVQVLAAVALYAACHELYMIAKDFSRAVSCQLVQRCLHSERAATAAAIAQMLLTALQEHQACAARLQHTKPQHTIACMSTLYCRAVCVMKGGKGMTVQYVSVHVAMT